jgi:glycosyltransferase involved in cell wall biosynthesis
VNKFFFCALTLLYATGLYSEEKHIVVIIPSYNNARWCEKNLESVFAQKYTNYNVIYTDDCSTDNTYELVTEVVKKYHQEDRVKVIRNKERCKALKNIVNMIYSCADTDIVLTLDGDDWLSYDRVFEHINNAYTDSDIWITYGQYAELNSEGKYIRGFNAQIPSWAIEYDLLRTQSAAFSHLRTFYAKLFKKIRLEDLMFNGEYFAMSWDLAFMIPMIEMARYHFKFIPQILYIYNGTNDINDHKVSKELQQMLDRIIRSRRSYPALPNLF